VSILGGPVPADWAGTLIDHDLNSGTADQIVYQKAGETWTAPYELSLDALDVATYTYHLNVIGVTPDPPTVTFTLGGADNGGGTDQDGNAVSVVAPSKFLTIPIVCETCNTQPPTIQAQETEDPLTVLTDPWVQQNVPFVLRATDAATGDNGVRRIFYRFPEGGGAEAAERPNLTGEEHTWTSACPRDGLPCFVVDVPGGGTAEPFTADVFFESSGVNTIQFWAEDGLGNISPANEVQSLNLTVRRPPTATSVTRTVAEDSSIDINVGELGSHPDGTAFGQTVSSPAVEYGTLIPKVGGPAGWYTYTPPADFFTPTGGPHVTFTHTLTDSPYGLTSQGTVTVVVTPVNDAPVAVDDAVTTSEETPITFAVLTNDDDGGGSLEIDALRVGDYVNPSDGDGVSRGTLVRNPDWTFTYTPPANWTGEATFTYQASDGSAMDTATVTITVTDTDDAPTAVNDVVDIDEDADETDLRVLNNDSHPDDDLLTLAIVTAPTKGVARIVNNAILYDSTLNANGNDSLQYRVTDESGDTATANVVIRIRPMPDTPTATDDSRTIPEDSAITIAVLENDIDPDRPGSIAGLGIRSFTPPRNASTNAVTGTLVRHGENTPGSADDTFTWTPPANFNGTVTFQYTIANADGGVDSATVTIVVSPGNDAPVGNDAAFTTAEDTAYSGQLTGSDLDGDTLTFSRTTLPLHGTVTVNANGSYTYTPATDYNGSDSFTATVSDGNGGSDLITVTITVTPVNDLPVAFVDTGTTAEDTPITINVITNDTSGDGSLTIAATVPPPAASGTIAVVGSSITFTPALNFLGDVSFSYRVTDPDGDASNANVDIRVTAANDAPTVVDDTATTPEDTAINIAVLGNDTDVDGDTLDVTSVTQPASGGSVSLNANDTVRFVPVADFSGTVTFTYTATDGTVSRTATVTVTVTPVNDPPTAQPDSYSVVEGQTLVVPAPGVLVNDSDVDDTTLTAARVSSPSRGTLTLLANGGFTYESTLGYIGPVTFTYDAVDDDGLTAQATVTITVLTRNTAPICSAATASPSTLWPPNHRVIDPIAITGVTDADGDAVTITVKYIWQDEPTNTLGDGDFAIDGFGVGTDTPSVRRERQGTRSTPPGDGRVYEIGFEAVDTKGGSCTGSVMVGIPHDQGQLSTPIDSVCRWDSTIANGPVLNACAGGGAPSNQAPTVSASNQTTQAGTAASVQISGSDPEGLTLTWGATGLPPGLTIGATGLITGTPLPAGVGEHQVTVSATDPNGASGSASFTWTITAANQLPTGVTDSYEASAGETLQVAAPGVLGNDSDMDGDDLTAVLVSGPASGTLTLNPDGSFSYVPAPGFSGDATFTYRSRDDNEGESDPVTVTIAVTAPLVAENDQYVASAGTVLNVAAPGVLGNDEVPTGAGEASVAVVSDPANGSVVLQTNGAFAYTPPANYGGTVTFTYRITRGAQTSNTATVSIRVNRPPTAVADTYTVEGNTTLTVSGEGVLGNDSDPDGGMLTAEIAQAASNGTVSLSANGSFTYTPANGFVGTATFAYRAVDDDDAESESTTVTITVTATAPTAAADTYSTRTNLALTTAAPGVLGNDENPAGGAMTAEVVTNPANGTVALQANGGFTYTPEDGFTGTDTFTYRAVVGETESAPATVTLTVTATPPAGAKVRRETYFNSTSIVEGSVHIMNAVNIAFNGTSTLTGDLLVQGMPTIQVNGTVNYEGTIDGGGAATPATRIITLNAGTTVGHVVRRTDPEAWPTIANPSTTYGGTRAVTLNSNGDSPGDFGTLRDLTINQSGRQVAVPAGTYRTFTANSGSVFVLGVAGATEASVYDFQNLRLNGGSRIEVVGPVIVTVRNAMTPTGSIGSAARPDWLTLRVTTGNLELTNNMSLYGYVFVPTRTVVINGGTQLIGTVLADRLTLNSNARLTLLP
jgi:VCBS repeat-containing protein